MRNRWVFSLTMILAAGLSGCASMTNREGTPSIGPRAWNEAPAPPQRSMASAAPTEPPMPTDIFDQTSAKPTGLSKYFPGLQRNAAEPPRIVARYRPTWFGLRPNPSASPAVSPPTTYMTDARAGLIPPNTETPATLPVAIQVPAPRSSNDGSVTTTGVDQPTSVPNSKPDAVAAAPVQPASAAPNSVIIPDFGGKPSKPGDDEVNPLPPALEPGLSTPKPGARMPEVPPVDPLERAGSTSEENASKPSTTPVVAPTTDDKAMKAITTPANPGSTAGQPDSTVPASYPTTIVAAQAVGFKKLADCKIFASPQSPPKPSPQSVAKPTPQSIAKPTPQVKPTSQSPVPTSLTKASPQSSGTCESCGKPIGSTEWQRPCLRRLVRKVCKLGEYANPPTAAPH